METITSKLQSNKLSIHFYGFIVYRDSAMSVCLTLKLIQPNLKNKVTFYFASSISIFFFFFCTVNYGFLVINHSNK